MSSPNTDVLLLTVGGCLIALAAIVVAILIC
jgi:hypothetical protein